jgi:hypothetical protein
VAQQLKEGIQQMEWDYMKFKNFSLTKEMFSKLKRSFTGWEKIFASYPSDKQLVTRVEKELKKLNFPKINFEEMGRLSEQHLFKGRSSSG